MSRLGFVLLGFVTAGFVACSPAQPTNIEQPHPPLVLADSGPARAFASPAHWSILPSSAWVSFAQAPVPDGNVQVGSGGERWLVNIPTSSMTAATDLAPESLVGVTQTSTGFRFAGKSGTLYEAPAALAPLVRSGDPVKGARNVALGQKSILAIDGNGDLVRSSDGRDWKKVEIAGRDGVFTSIAMKGATGLLVAAPQRIYYTTDDGLTWKTATSPGDGIKKVKTDESGVLLEGATQTYSFSSSSGTFTQTAAKTPKRYQPPSKAQRVLAMDGKTGLVVESDVDAREHKVAVFEVGQSPTPKKIDALDGCVHVQPAIRGTSLMLACDAVGTIATGINTDKSPLYTLLRNRTAGGDAGKETGMITKLFKSEDRGKSFVADQTFDGGQVDGNDTSFYLGENGFAYLGERCVPYGPRACAGARVRTGGAWVELPEDGLKHVAFATRAGQPMYSLGVDGKTTALVKWPQGGAPEQVVVLGSNPATIASLDVDDTGVRGFMKSYQSTGPNSARASAGEAFEVKGTAITKLTIPEHTTTAAFAGKLGLAIDTHGGGFETTDGGKTWYGVGIPSGTSSIAQCTEDGCLTTRGLRAGWEGQGTPMKPKAAEPSKYAKPLKCKATGTWASLGGGDIPSAENADQGPLRWLMPSRDVAGAVTLYGNKWADAAGATTKTVMIGAAPGPPTYGAATVMHVQPGGVVVARYSYLRARNPNTGGYNPVDFNAVWYRASAAKVFRAAVPKLPAFRVNKDPRFDHDRTPATGEWPEIVWLGPKGVYFRSPAYPDSEEWTLYTLREDGKIDRNKTPELRGNEGRVVDLGSQLAVLSGDEDQWGVYGTNDRKELVLAPMGGLDGDEGPLSVFDFGGKPAFLGTSTIGTPRAWAIPIAAQADIGSTSAMPTQLSLGDVPKGCDAPLADPKGFRAVLPYVYGSRHPMTVDVDSQTHVLATKRSTVHGVTGPDACTAAFEAIEESPEDVDAEELGALVFPNDPGGSLLFRAKKADWPTAVSVRPMSCTFEAGPLPEVLQGSDGFTP